MASVRVDGFDDVIKLLDKLSSKAKVDDIAKGAVNAAKDIVAGTMSGAIASSEGHRGGNGARHRANRSTGSVAGSVKSTAAKVNSYGVFSVAKPDGRDANGTRNGKKAALLEYGTPQFSARPWRSRAVSSAEGQCVRIIEDYVKSEMGAE